MGNIDIAKYLLQIGANVNEVDRYLNSGLIQGIIFIYVVNEVNF